MKRQNLLHSSKILNIYLLYLSSLKYATDVVMRSSSLLSSE